MAAQLQENRPTANQLLEENAEDILEAYRALERRLKDFERLLKAVLEGAAILLEGKDFRPLPAKPMVLFQPKIRTIVDAKEHNSNDPAARTRTSGRREFAAFKRIEKLNPGKELLLDVLTRITYQENSSTNTSPICPGFVGVPIEVIKTADHVNVLKEKLKQAIEPIRGKTIKVSPGSDETRELTTELFRRYGLTDVNLQAAYRFIPVIRDEVSALKFMVIRTRTVKNARVKELRDRIEGFNSSADREHDLKVLSSLPDDELLRRPSTPYERVRARVDLTGTGPFRSRQTIKELSKGGHYIEMPGELPILFPRSEQLANAGDVPTLEPYDAKNPRSAPRPKLMSEPALKTMPYYRLLPEFRRPKKKDKVSA